MFLPRPGTNARQVVRVLMLELWRIRRLGALAAFYGEFEQNWVVVRAELGAASSMVDCYLGG